MNTLFRRQLSYPPRSQLKQMFPAVHFVNTIVREERTQVLLFKNEFNKLTYDSTNIFKKSKIGWYNHIPNALYSDGIYRALDNFVILNFHHATL